MKYPVNMVVKNLADITVENVDIELLKSQKDSLRSVLTQTDCRLLVSQREALRGVNQLLDAVISTASAQRSDPPRFGRLNVKQVNQVRDLDKCGKSIPGIAEQIGCKHEVVRRVLAGDTYTKVKYVPSEFAPPNTKERKTGLARLSH